MGLPSRLRGFNSHRPLFSPVCLTIVLPPVLVCSKMFIRQERTNVPAKLAQFLFLFFAEGTELLGVNIDPCSQPLEAVIVQMDAPVPIRPRQKIEKPALHSGGLSHYRSVTFAGEFLQIIFSE